MNAAVVVVVVLAGLVAFLCLLLLVRVSATRRNLKGLSATLASFQNKTHDYLQSLTAGLSAVERTMAESDRQRPIAQSGGAFPTAEFERIRTSLQMVSGQLAELASTETERTQALEREVTALTVSTEARLEELRATLETKLKTQEEEWQHRMTELRAESDERLQHSSENAARALDEANLAVSQLQGLVHDRLSQALAVQHGQVDAVLERLEALTRESTCQQEANRAEMKQQLELLAEENDRKLANVLTSFQRQLATALEGVVNRFTELDWLIKQMSESVVVLARDLEEQQAGLKAVQTSVSTAVETIGQVTSSCRAAIDERLVGAAEEQAGRLQERLNVLGAALTGLRHELTEQFGARLQELAGAVEQVSARLAAQSESEPEPSLPARFESELEQLRSRLVEVTDALGRLGPAIEQRLAEFNADQRTKLETLITGLANLRQDGAETGRLLEEGLSRMRPEAGSGHDQQHAELARLIGDQSVLVERLATEVSHLAAQVAELHQPGTEPAGQHELGRLVPVPGGNGDRVTWMPIDIVSPADVYEKLVQARSAGDAEAVARAGNELETAILSAAAAMRRKYGALPGVADVAIMFLPVEGLYAEVLLRSTLCRSLHRDYRVVIASPATLDSLLTDARTGERTGPAITSRL